VRWCKAVCRARCDERPDQAGVSPVDQASRPANRGPIGDRDRSYGHWAALAGWVRVKPVLVRASFTFDRGDEQGPRKVGILQHRDLTAIIILDDEQSWCPGNLDNLEAISLGNEPRALYRPLSPSSPWPFVALELLRVENPIPSSTAGVERQDRAARCQAVQFALMPAESRRPCRGTRPGKGHPGCLNIYVAHEN
jgi:hypothetical protein